MAPTANVNAITLRRSLALGGQSLFQSRFSFAHQTLSGDDAIAHTSALKWFTMELPNAKSVCLKLLTMTSHGFVSASLGAATLIS